MVNTATANMADYWQSTNQALQVTPSNLLFLFSIGIDRIGSIKLNKRSDIRPTGNLKSDIRNPAGFFRQIFDNRSDILPISDSGCINYSIYGYPVSDLAPKPDIC